MRPSLALVACCLCYASAALAGDINPKKATEPELVACLEDPSVELRLACVDQLGRRGLVSQQGPLLAAAKGDGAPKVRVAALDALQDLEAPHLAAAAEHMVAHDPERANRAHALAVIERDCADSSAPAVVAAMADEDPTIARKAVIIVGKRGFSEGEPWLVEQGVDHPEQAVMVQAWKTLTRLGNPDHRPMVHRALASGEEAVRKAVVRALRDTVLPQDRDALVGALDDPNTHVARDAAKALVGLGDPSVASVLREKAASTADEAVKGDFEKCADKLEGL